MTTTTTLKPNYAAHPIPEPVGFCFTYAIDGGAWLAFANGERNWFSFGHIRHFFGQRWIDDMMHRQGWMTGTWVNCKGDARPCPIA